MSVLVAQVGSFRQSTQTIYIWLLGPRAIEGRCSPPVDSFTRIFLGALRALFDCPPKRRTTSISRTKKNVHLIWAIYTEQRNLLYTLGGGVLLKNAFYYAVFYPKKSIL